MGRTPATLVELAFLTNPYEAARLAHDDYRQALAQAVADGIAERLPAARPAAQSLAGAQTRIDGVHPSEHNPNMPGAAELRADQILFCDPPRDPRQRGRPVLRRPLRRRAREPRRRRRVPLRAGARARGDSYLESQSDTLVSAVQPLLPGDLPPTFDFEDEDNADDVPWHGGAWLAPISAFLDRVETALGRVPMIYTQQSVWQAHIEDPITDASFAYLADYPLWVIDVPFGKAQRYAHRNDRGPAGAAAEAVAGRGVERLGDLAVLRRLHADGVRPPLKTASRRRTWMSRTAVSMPCAASRTSAGLPPTARATASSRTHRRTER